MTGTGDSVEGKCQPVHTPGLSHTHSLFSNEKMGNSLSFVLVKEVPFSCHHTGFLEEAGTI